MATSNLSLRTTVLGLLASALSLSLLTGCSSSFDPLEGTTAPLTALGTISGTAHGGQGPISGASIYVYQVNASAYGGASVQLANPVTTDANGKFLINSYTTTCTSGRPVYLYSVGGNSGAGVNSAAGLLAALGPCPASGTLAAAYPYVNMNEVSTVAMAYSLAGFAVDATHIGYSGTALSLQGITNAFATSQNIYSITSTYPTLTAATNTGATSGPNVGALPTQLINTVADALAQCVNSNGPASGPCNTTTGLFHYATSSGVAGGGTAPTDTATAAIYIAQHPGSNASAIWSLDGGSGSPFQTALSSAPANLTLTIAYTATDYDAASLFPRELAVDAAGNVWAADGDNFLDKFTPTGVATHYTDSHLSQPIAIAIDNAASSGGTPTVYVASFANAQVTRFNGATGAEINSYLSASNANGGPADLAIDNLGNIWSANYNDGANGSVGKQTSSGTGTASLYTGVSGGSLANPTSIAADATGNLYVLNYNSGALIKFASTGVGTLLSATGGGTTGGDAIAVDSSADLWCANYQSLTKVTPGGSVTTDNYPTTGEFQNGIAVDGLGNVWTAAEDGTSGGLFVGTGEIDVFNSAGTQTNGSSGYAVSAAPDSIALDGSGNVWYSDANSNILHEVVGAAAPVVTPLSYGTANAKIGTRP